MLSEQIIQDYTKEVESERFDIQKLKILLLFLSIASLIVLSI